MALHCLLFALGLWAQEDTNYCVFQVEGNPTLIDEEAQPLVKGMFVYPKHSLSLNEGDKVILTDGEGVLYEIKKKVTMPYDRIQRYTKKEKQSAFTLEYLKYVWQKLWEREEKQNIGVVFRAPNSTQPIFPLDSVKLFMAAVPFEWQEPKSEKIQYMYLQQETSDDFVKLATNGTKIILPVDGKLLQTGTSYRWTVTSESDPSLEEMEFHSFELLQKEMFEARLRELNAIRMEFRSLGLSDEEIRRSFCEDEKLCFN
jgi:hypothetical protein